MSRFDLLFVDIGGRVISGTVSDELFAGAELHAERIGHGERAYALALLDDIVHAARLPSKTYRVLGDGPVDEPRYRIVPMIDDKDGAEILVESLPPATQAKIRTCLNDVMETVYSLLEMPDARRLRASA